VVIKIQRFCGVGFFFTIFEKKKIFEAFPNFKKYFIFFIGKAIRLL